MTYRLAMPTGRMLKQAEPFLAACGIVASEPLSKTRKLKVPSKCGRYEFLLVKPVDAPLYVEQGVADAGIAGRDVLIEQAPDVLEPLDLGFAVCRMVVAGLPQTNGSEDNPLRPLRVATKYPRIASRYLNKKRRASEIFKLSGSVEIGAVLGLADVVVDIVETGTTLRENGLVIHEEIVDCSAHLIYNRGAWYSRLQESRALLEILENGVKNG